MKWNYETVELGVLEKDESFGNGAAVNVAVVPGVAKAFEVVYLLIKINTRVDVRQKVDVAVERVAAGGGELVDDNVGVCDFTHFFIGLSIGFF